MYLLCFALFATSILTECVSQEASLVDFSRSVSPEVYQRIIKQGFATNYFKSQSLAIKYRDQNIDDIYDKGFRNVRLRSRADLYTPPYTAANFTLFLLKLTEVVDKCLEVGVAPIVSWIHHDAEARASEEDREDYLTWWRIVAETLKHKSYHLAFNLFTELGVDQCGTSCEDSLRESPDKYNEWTSEVIRTIRATGGNNAERILILASPGKTSRGLLDIDESIYKNDDYLMVEWHDYAAGPNKKSGSRRYWSGSGIEAQRKNLKNGIKRAKEFTEKSGLLSYFGAWMPRDNDKGALNEEEVISFAQFFVDELKNEQIPWSLNVLDDYYDTSKSRWITGPQDLVEGGHPLHMSRVLESILAVM